MFVGIGLRLGAQLLGGTSPLALYAAAGITPQLVADFKGGTYGKASALSTFDGVLEHSRASSATYVDSSGVLQTATSGVARTDHHVYNGTAWVKEGYLHEPEAATNLVTYSDTLSNAAWSIANATLGATLSATIALEKLVEDTATGEHFVYRTTGFSGLTTSTRYTTSFYVATAERTATRHNSFFYNNLTLILDHSTQSVLSTSGGTTPIVVWDEVGSGVYRCSIDDTVTAASGNFTSGLVQSGTTFSYTGDGSSGLYIGGFQLEQGSVPTSYIPTSGSQVTRAADILTLPIENIPYPTGDNIAVSFGYKALVTYADDATNNALYSWRLDNSNRADAFLLTAGGATGRIKFNFNSTTGGTISVNSGATQYSPGINVPVSIAARNGSTFINGAVDGTALTADTTPTVFPDLSTTDLVIASSGGPQVIQEFIMWGGETGDIGDAGIEETSA